jgi:hypothetical protein
LKKHDFTAHCEKLASAMQSILRALDQVFFLKMPQRTDISKTERKTAGILRAPDFLG